MCVGTHFTIAPMTGSAEILTDYSGAEPLENQRDGSGDCFEAWCLDIFITHNNLFHIRHGECEPDGQCFNRAIKLTCYQGLLGRPISSPAKNWFEVTGAPVPCSWWSENQGYIDRVYRIKDKYMVRKAGTNSWVFICCCGWECAPFEVEGEFTGYTMRPNPRFQTAPYTGPGLIGGTIPPFELDKLIFGSTAATIHPCRG